MIRFLDTSVLIPAFLIDHQDHTLSRRLLGRCNPQTDMCAAHSLAEFYATITRLPHPNRASPQQALRFIENVEQHLGFVSLTPVEYQAAIRSAASAGITGGTTYDFLIARCALKAQADAIYTWNIKHFQLFGPDVLSKLRLPDATV